MGRDMNEPKRPFDRSELQSPADPEATTAEIALAAGIARTLETMTTDGGIRPTDDFEDRVMAAIALEPAPRLVVRSGRAGRGGRLAVFLLAVRESWAVAGSRGHPLAVRGQALGFVLLVVLAAGALTGLTAVAVGGLVGRDTVPTPSIDVAPSIMPSPTPSPTPTVVPSPTPTPNSPESTEPGDTSEPNESGESEATAVPAKSRQPVKTAKPAGTPRPTRTARPTETPDDSPEPSDDGGEREDAGKSAVSAAAAGSTTTH
jgi:hypothetical protein